MTVTAGAENVYLRLPDTLPHGVPYFERCKTCKNTTRYILKGSDDGVQYSELLCFLYVHRLVF
jgi:hypothetical protein